MDITNEHGISLPLAVWLMHDQYDHIKDANYISTTKLIRPLKQLIMPQRVPANTRSMDISSLIASRFGTAVHDSIELAWRENYAQYMQRLNYDNDIVDNIVIDPEEGTDLTDKFPIYMEKRAIREINGYRIGGKFDMVINGRLYDFKTTSVFSYINASKDEDYMLQGSIYRWLNPDLIKDDHIYIQFIFTDWQAFKARGAGGPSYPPLRVQEYPVKLLSLEETERYIVNKLRLYEQFKDAPEDQIPPCSDKDLWRGAPIYKYYKNPASMTRATKNFDDLGEARLYQATEQKGVGIIVPVVGEAKACLYCAAFDICKQKDEYHVQS